MPTAPACLGIAVGTAECLVMAFSLSDWLETIGLGRYVAVFEANDVDFEVLSHLSDEDLLALGHRASCRTPVG